MWADQVTECRDVSIKIGGFSDWNQQSFFWNAEFFAARHSWTKTEEKMSGMGTLPRDARRLWKRPRQPTGVYTEIGGKIGRIHIYYVSDCHSYGVTCCPGPLHPLRRQTLRVRGFLTSSTILVPIQKSHSPNCQRYCLYLVRFPMLLTQTSNLLSDNAVLLPNWNIRIKCFYDKAKK